MQTDRSTPEYRVAKTFFNSDAVPGFGFDGGSGGPALPWQQLPRTISRFALHKGAIPARNVLLKTGYRVPDT
jgi:hypothetical protein